jgi:hypothetical protein
MGGMNVARLNMCHGTRDWHTQVIRNVRSLNSEKGYSVAIMMDTEGSEIHMGDFDGAPSVKAEVREKSLHSLISSQNFTSSKIRACNNSSPEICIYVDIPCQHNWRNYSLDRILSAITLNVGLATLNVSLFGDWGDFSIGSAVEGVLEML